MYAIIVKSNSGTTYVYGTFECKEEAEKFASRQFPSHACTYEVALYLPAIELPM